MSPSIPGRLLFIVPAFNERSNLPGVVADLRAHYPAAGVLVVNDGSTDGTGTLAALLGVELLDLPFNVGIGGAVQAGLIYADEEGYEIAVQFDGDGQHRADQVGKLLQALQSAPVVIGSRFLGRGGHRSSLLRRIGMSIIRLVNSLVIGRRITDSTSGFRAYRREAIRFLARDYPHDFPEPESVVTLFRHGFSVAEVAVTMRERQDGTSSITLGRAVYYMAKVLVAILIGATREPLRRQLDESASSDSLHYR